MTPAQGQKRIKALLGPKAAWRDNGAMTSPERRAETAEKMCSFRALHEARKAALDARRRELLADPLFQQLHQETQELYRQMNECQAQSLRYRLTVGLNQTWCFEVKAEGDNWADIVRKLEASQEAK